MDQKNQTKCSICYKILPYNSSTSSMQSHLSIDHCINSKISKKSTTLLNDDDISDIESGNENGFEETGHKKLNRLLVNFIVGTDQPISIVRHPDFVNLVSELNKSYKMPCINTVSKKLIPSITDNLKSILMLELKGCRFITITCDSWSSLGYLGVTCHFIDKNMTLVDRNLDLKFMSEMKTAEYLFNTLNEIFSEWSINNKIFALVTDSGANIFSAVNKFDDNVLKIPCAGHRLNLVVNDLLNARDIKVKKIKNGLKRYQVKDYDGNGKLINREITESEVKEIEKINEGKLEIAKVISSCRHIVGSFKHLEMLQKKLKEVQETLRYETKIKLVQDIAIRWNSQFDMIESILTNKTALDMISIEFQNIKDYLPTATEFKVLEDLCDLLHPIKELTKLFSGKKYVTVTFLFPTLYSLLNEILESQPIFTELVKTFQKELLRSLKGRFKYIFANDFFLAATFLDFKFRKFEFIKNDIYRYECISKAKMFIKTFYEMHLKETEEIDITIETNCLNNTLNSFNSSADNTIKTFQQLSTSPIANNITLVNNKRRKSINLIELVTDKSCCNLIESNDKLEKEINDYSLQYFHSYENSAIEFFQANQKLFPVLTQIARIIFSVPATSVPSECLFSSTGLIDTELRNKLAPSLLKQLVFIKENK
ncbi:E3 SUMO-protein ligase ZBED1-like [Hydra vulgaris]|uniref:E3 SUMO-protein ligase ZBED1-like n=1 Tax=Hydra vulgaris TaxID=6087 RepID=UPI0032E9F1EC